MREGLIWFDLVGWFGAILQLTLFFNYFASVAGMAL